VKLRKHKNYKSDVSFVLGVGSWELGVWGLGGLGFGFGVWDVGFGVWGLGPRGTTKLHITLSVGAILRTAAPWQFHNIHTCARTNYYTTRTCRAITYINIAAVVVSSKTSAARVIVSQ
jgi:glucose dehydrogenase